MTTISEQTILVTGFGPFEGHEVNASWEAVQELYNLKNDLSKEYNVNLIIDNVPVDYDYVSNKVPELWKQHEPEIVIHVGVSPYAKSLTIERQAHGTGYVRPDINDKCPTENCKEAATVLETEIDIAELCRKFNDTQITSLCEASISDDPGHYLCSYIYHKSLMIDPRRTLFIHVPDLSVYPSKLTAKGLYDIIGLLCERL